MSIWVFRKGRTTKYMYLSPHCDTYGDMDKSQVTLLASFDLSVAFDSVDNNYLLSRLSITSGAKDLPEKGSLISRNVLIMHVIHLVRLLAITRVLFLGITGFFYRQNCVSRHGVPAAMDVI